MTFIKASGLSTKVHHVLTYMLKIAAENFPLLWPLFFAQGNLIVVRYMEIVSFTLMLFFELFSNQEQLV